MILPNKIINKHPIANIIESLINICYKRNNIYNNELWYEYYYYEYSFACWYFLYRKNKLYINYCIKNYNIKNSPLK